MKKYQQLLIVSLGLVSFICFLIYKHEYDRLRNVLEVLEVFGSPPPQAAGLAAVAHPLELGHNPNLGVGSINELKLGQGGLVEVQNQKEEMAKDKIQNSGEIVDEGGGAGDDKLIDGHLIGAHKNKKQRPDSIFKETQYQKD